MSKQILIIITYVLKSYHRTRSINLCWQYPPHFKWRANNYRNPINFLHLEDEMDYFFWKEFCVMLEEMNTKHKCQQKKFGSRTTRRKKILRICYLYESRLDPSFIIFYLEYTLLNFVKDNQMQNILQGYHMHQGLHD